jgi:hypothetical protein
MKSKRGELEIIVTLPYADKLQEYLERMSKAKGSTVITKGAVSKMLPKGAPKDKFLPLYLKIVDATLDKYKNVVVEPLTLDRESIEVFKELNVPYKVSLYHTSMEKLMEDEENYGEKELDILYNRWSNIQSMEDEKFFTFDGEELEVNGDNPTAVLVDVKCLDRDFVNVLNLLKDTEVILYSSGGCIACLEKIKELGLGECRLEKRGRGDVREDLHVKVDIIRNELSNYNVAIIYDSDERLVRYFNRRGIYSMLVKN